MKLKEATSGQPQITSNIKIKTNKSSKSQIIILRNDKKKSYRITTKGQMRSPYSMPFIPQWHGCILSQAELSEEKFLEVYMTYKILI